MRITFFGHASMQVQLDDTTVICDPHFAQTYGAGLFGTFPARRISECKYGRQVIFISHRHRDHLNLETLARFPQATPIICPRDSEVILALQLMGFADINVVSSWQQIRIGNATIAPTPSRYSVPEHGLLIWTDTEAVWNLVDSVTDASIVAAAYQRLQGRRCDLVLWPYQPLKEVEVVDSGDLRFPYGRFEANLQVLRLINPKHVVPYADGQIGIGETRWINHYRFPVGAAHVDRCIRETLPDVEIVRPLPGAVIEVSAGAVASVARAPFVQVLSTDSGERVFDATMPVPEVGVVPEHLMSETASLEVLEEVLNVRLRAFVGSTSTALFSRAASELGIAYVLVIESSVQGELILEYRPPAIAFARLSGVPTDALGICCIRITASVLERLIDGRVHFISAYLAGLFRTWEAAIGVVPGRVVRPVVTPSVSDPSSDGRMYVLSPSRWFNALLGQDSGLWERVLEAEVQNARVASGSV